MKFLTFFFFYSIAVFANTTNYCFVGDLGSGNDNQQKLVKKMVQSQCNKIFLLGDLVYPDGIESLKDKNLEKNFLSPMAPLLVSSKIFLAVGNHDYHERPQAWIDVANTQKNIHFPDLYYRTDQKNVCFFVLDSTPFHKLRYYFVRKKQIEWFKNEIKKSTECKLKFIIAHHPFVSSGGHGDASGAYKDFISEFIVGKVNYFIAGHDHVLSDEGVENGIHHYVAGGGGRSHYEIKRIKEGKFQKSVDGFLFMQIDEEKGQVIEEKFIESYQ